MRVTTSTTTMRAVEQLANFEARLADDIADGQAERARELYELGHRTPRATSRRCRDSRATQLARKRVQASRRRRTELQNGQGRRCLRRPNTTGRRIVLSLQRQGLDPYPALNWLTLATLLDEQVPDADALLERCEATARERFSIDRSFFTAIGIADAALVRALRSGRLGQDGQAGDDEVVRLQTSLPGSRQWLAPTACELDSVGKQIDITGRLLEKICAQPREHAGNGCAPRRAARQDRGR